MLLGTNFNKKFEIFLDVRRVRMCTLRKEHFPQLQFPTLQGTSSCLVKQMSSELASNLDLGPQTSKWHDLIIGPLLSFYMYTRSTIKKKTIFFQNDKLNKQIFINYITRFTPFQLNWKINNTSKWTWHTPNIFQYILEDQKSRWINYLPFSSYVRQQYVHLKHIWK